MHRSLVHKRLSFGFVLTIFLSIDATIALADDLPPPPPPPPGVGPVPTAVPVGTGVLEAPPPPPPGSIDQTPTPQVIAPPKPEPTNTTGLSEPPPAPPGVEKSKPPKRIKKARRQAPAQPMTPFVQNVPDKPQRQWYGWQSLIGVVPSHAMLIAGWELNQGTLLFVGSLGSLFMSPIAHWGNKQTGKGWGSFAGNAGSALIGALIGEEVGALTGLMLWTVIDVSALQYRDKPPEKPANNALGIQSFAVMPMFDKTRAGLNFVGQF